MRPAKRRGRWQWSVVWPVVGIVALWTAFVLVLRLRIRPVIDRLRAFNKRLLNPVMLRLAGRRHWYAAALEHTGRHTGRAYMTPVVAEPTDNGFVIPLPYGERVDWLRNVLAAGHATITAKATRYTVDQPHVVDRAVAEPLLPPRLRRSFRLYGIDRFLLVRTCATPESLSAELPVEQSLPELAPPVEPIDDVGGV